MIVLRVLIPGLERIGEGALAGRALLHQLVGAAKQ
jgi:hypothetical protein